MALNQGGSFCSGINFQNRRFSEDRPDKNRDCFGKSWGLDCGKGNFQGNRKEEIRNASDDVADLLPQDPFDMNIDTIEIGFVIDEIGVGKVDDQLFAGFDFVLNGSKRIHPESGAEKMNENSGVGAMDFGNGEFDGHVFSDCEMDETMDFSYEKYWIFYDEINKREGLPGEGFQGEGGSPPDALPLALYRLGVEDLLFVEQVCKSLRDEVQNNPLLWRKIKIDHPLSDKITDDALLQLTNRAQGRLHCLSLVECLKITDSGLKNVLERNKTLTKLSVAGCTKLSIGGLLSNLKVFKYTGNPGIKCLRIGGLFGVTNQHFEELKLLLGVNNSQLPTARKPRFYQAGQLYLSVDDDDDDDHALDIETCPKCEQLRLVYDCPAESCQGDQQGTQLCRACTFCIPRCKSCGCCLSNRDYEETFCLENLCSDCIQKFLPKHSFFHPQASYRFFLCG
ncbi:PREDICTED: F-box protein SKIP14-like [Ipomoea nil]|uniref:F-box protein SKIP14-like n=1 Tax=Ipomoea nil TaxID=35883 RepID=UPI0009012A37|nr:PREDICTED: F-box protein SKIP14-like [Ipomoea nil]